MAASDSGFFRLATARKAMREEPVAMRWYVLCVVLLLLAVACTCFAVWTASSARETTPLANANASDSLSLAYSVQGSNGQSHEVRESVSFGDDGLAESSTLSIQAENDEAAALLLADAKERFGAAWSGGSVEGGVAVFTVDVRSEHVDRKTYQALIMESTTDARVLDAA